MKIVKLSHATAALLMAACLASCASVEQADAVKSYTRCEIHGCEMEHVVLTRDEYAGRMMPESFYAARGGIFPHSGTEFPVCTFYPNRDMTWRCSECARAGKIWCRKHLRNQPFL